MRACGSRPSSCSAPPVPRDSPAFYFLCLGVLILTIVGTLNLLRSPTGRAFVAIRDSETAARSMGVNVSLYKVKSFAISAAITGFAGCLFAHKLSFISPEMFTLQLSIEFIIVILIGGTFSLHGAVLGAIFIVMIDPFLTYLKDDVPGMVAGVAAALGAGAERARAYPGQRRRVRLRQRPEGRDLRGHHRRSSCCSSRSGSTAAGSRSSSSSSCSRSTSARPSSGRRST